MSTIKKMQIQGIRSFSPEERDKSLIEFFAPLTLILGPNGTGKTTVIECLKYMTTGQMPPGCSKGGAFVHDPKLAHEAIVQAQVRLYFRDVRNKETWVTRSLKATQKPAGVTLQTIDGTITTLDQDGKKVSVGKKCVEIDNEMSNLLGVSKAVLENVIFVHQEDSCWPMSEGKNLKEKFDDIFASTRYVKAIDSIIKLRKIKGTEITEYKTEVKFLKLNKEKATEIQNEYENTKTRYAASHDEVEKIDEKLKPINIRLLAINTREADIWKLDGKITELKTKKRSTLEAIQELRDVIKNEFKGETVELQQQLSEFSDCTKEGEKEMRQINDQIDKVERRINDISDKKSKMLVQHGKLEQEQKHNQDNIVSRNNLVNQLSNDYNIDGFSGTLSNSDSKNFIERLGDHAQGILDHAKAQRAKHDTEEAEIQRDVDKARRNKTELETELNIKKNTIKENRSEVKRLTSELNRVDASAGRLDTVTHELCEAERDLDATDASVDVPSIRTEVVTLQQDKTDLDASLKKLDIELNRLHQESSTRTQLDMITKDKNSKEQQIQRLMNKNEESLCKVLGVDQVSVEDVRTKLEKQLNLYSEEVRRQTKHLGQLNMTLSSRESERKSLNDQIKELEREISKLEEQMEEECEGHDLNRKQIDLKVKIKDKTEERGMFEGMDAVLRRYMRNLGSSEHAACPLCTRDFETESEVEELRSSLDTQVQKLPSKITTLTTSIEEMSSKFNRLLQLDPVKDRLVELKENTLPKLKKRLADNTKSINDIKIEETQVSMLLDEHKENEEESKLLQPDCVRIQSIHAELRDVKRKLAPLQAKLANSDSGRNVQQVSDERTDIQERLETTNRKLDNKRQKISEHSENVNRLQTQVNQLKTEKLKIDHDLQERNKLAETKEDLVCKLEILSVEVEEAQVQLQPLTQEIQQCVRQKDVKAKEKIELFDKEKDRYMKVKGSITDVDKVQRDIDRYINEGRDQKIDRSVNEIRLAEEKAAQLESERETCTSKQRQMQEDIDTQTMRERELKDNLSLRTKTEEVERLGTKIIEQEGKLGGLEVSKIEKEKQDLLDMQDSLRGKKERASGRLNELENQMDNHKKELKSDMYKDAEQTYRDKMISLKTTELANSDLEKYHKALEWTIMSYHKTKMSEINKIIRELWRNTYRGNDIETIEIVSDEETMTTQKRRTYNYRVVMVKGDCSLDMRGRCSAGQKVLASLIIRLALAETFCLNCGILALDEPTTNLDRENIESLAYALAEIIKGRANQRNFQLIVITHDEDFVELLGRSDYVDEFFKVRKTPEGYSQLVRARVSDLHTR